MLILSVRLGIPIASRNTCFSSLRAEVDSVDVNQNEGLFAIPANAPPGTDDMIASFCIMHGSYLINYNY
jgi:hypothetical protein